MNRLSLSKSIPRNGNGNSSRARFRACMTISASRTTIGMHSVHPVATSVSTNVCTNAPDTVVPPCATKSTSTQPGAGLPQSLNVRIGTLRRTAEPNPAGRRRPLPAAKRTPASKRSIVAALTCSSFARVASSSVTQPCRSKAGNNTVIIGCSRFEHTRSATSQSWISASRTSGPYRPRRDPA